MNLFFDTSALVKLFHKEEGSEVVTKLMTAQENEVWISELVRIEFFSAVLRRFRNKEIDEMNLSEAISGFEEQLTSFNIEPFGHAVLVEAEILLKKYGRNRGLRTLDALHLGEFRLISESDWFFVASDGNLCEVAQLIGLKTINPLNYEV
jgi:predicted nucleic acid-binding protein